MVVTCPNCGSFITVGEQIGGKLGIGAASAILGSKMGWEGAVLFGLVGMVLGHFLIDSNPTLFQCPSCLAALQVVGDLPA